MALRSFGLASGVSAAMNCVRPRKTLSPDWGVPSPEPIKITPVAFSDCFPWVMTMPRYWLMTTVPELAMGPSSMVSLPARRLLSNCLAWALNARTIWAGVRLSVFGGVAGAGVEAGAAAGALVDWDV